MAQLTVPSAPKEYATQYRVLLGVDFRADQTEVDRRRSPDMVNMISDFGGNPVKRDGYRNVGKRYDSIVEVDGNIYGIYLTSSILTIYSLTLMGYEFYEATVATISKNFGAVRNAFGYQHMLYIVTTKALISYDVQTGTVDYTGVGAGMMSTGNVGETAPACASGIVPLVVIDLKPDGTGGTALDDANLMTIYRQVSYKGDGASTDYIIPICKKMGTWVKAEVMDANGDWQEVTVTLGASAHNNCWRIDGTSNIDALNYVDAKVSFTSPPSAPLGGEDNVRITFAPYSTEELYRYGNPSPQYRGYYNEHRVGLLAGGISTIHNNRMFIADKFSVYYSELSNPFIISDLAWFDVNSEVVGFSRSNNSLLILTRDTGTSTIYLAQEQMRTVDSTTGEIETYFTVKESNAGVGAIAPKCIATLIDEPMFLSNTGVYGILTNYLSDKYAVNRSSRINRKLCQEPNLEDAVGIAFNDYLYIAVNGRMYVLDGRHKESDRAGNKPLEAYYFEGLPAIENMWVVGDRMYFADNTKTYAWNDDLPDTERYFNNAYMKTVTDVEYQLGLIYNEETGNYYEEPTGEWLNTKPTPDENEVVWYKASFDDLSEEIAIDEFEVDDKKLTGDPVQARWCSVYDDDGAPHKLKTLMKKGSVITLVPHYQSGCEITLVKDGDTFEYLGSFNSNINSFDSIDFSNFTFNSNQVAIDNYTRKKVKKYKRLQIQVENNKAEPFGLTQITKTYTFGNYAKR